MATLSPARTTPHVRHTECFIDGQWIPARSGKTFATLNPATEEVIAQVAEGDAEDIDVAVRAAHTRLNMANGLEWMPAIEVG